MASGPSQISRYQRQRNVTFTAELNGRPLGEVMNEVQALPSVQHLPDGVSFLNTGDSEVFVELFVGFAIAMIAGLVCIYMVLLLLFNHALMRSEEHTSELQSLMRISYAVFCLKKKKPTSANTLSLKKY